jgi:hypothetical protein
MKLPKRILYILLTLVIATLVFIVLFGNNGIVKRERENYNETHREEMEDNNNKVIINN